MKKFNELNKSIKIGIVTFVITLLCFAASGFLLTTNLKDIPLGFLLGGGIISVLDVLQGFAEKKDDAKQSITFSMIVIISKFVVIITLILICALMFYRWNMPYFNIFAIVGIYTASLIVTVIFHLIDKR